MTTSTTARPIDRARIAALTEAEQARLDQRTSASRDLYARARAHLDAGRPLQAIHLAEIVTDTDDDDGARAVLRAAHERLLADSANFWETAWLTKQIERYS